jgi:protein-tyrosine sulfotransferase
MAVSGNTTRTHDLKKYWSYFFETEGLTKVVVPGPIDEAALAAARQARGADRGPAIFIHGVMPRSGTVYVGELLRRHPDLYLNPHQLWEFPGLLLTGEVRKLQQKFLLGYKPNIGKLSEDDFLPLFGAALMAYLHQPVPTHQRVLVKMASVQFVNHFFSMFPHENLLILMRDGRDLVHSTLRTWPRLNFVQVTLRWNRSAQAVLTAMRSQGEGKAKGFWLARYEDVLDDSVRFVTVACERFGLDPARYPFDEIDKIRVIGSSMLGQQAKFAWRHYDKPANFRPVRYWERWSPLKKSVFKLIAGRSLVDLGYSEDLKW